MAVSECEISGGEGVDVEGCESHRRRKGGSIVGAVGKGLGSDAATVLKGVIAGVSPKLSAGLPCECRKAGRPQQACNKGV